MEIIKEFKTPLLLFLIGILFTVLGAWMKILHMAYADITITAGMVTKAVGVIMAIGILVKTKR